MNQFETFTNAVRTCDALPERVRESARSVVGIETSSFDATYLEFLDQQIQLNARGDAWSQRLRTRFAGLVAWCGIPLIGGRIKLDNDDYIIKVEPNTGSVVYWEHYADCR